MGTQQERLSSASFQNHWCSTPTHSLLKTDVTTPGSAGLEITHRSLISSFSAFACLALLLDWVKHVCEEHQRTEEYVSSLKAVA